MAELVHFLNGQNLALVELFQPVDGAKVHLGLRVVLFASRELR
jgi:hypothetical protein